MAPTLFKATAIATFACGVAVHVLRVAVGIDTLTRQIVTPPVDIALGCLITVAAVTGALSWKRFVGSKAVRVGYGFAMFMLIVSVPIHLRTALTWSTDYLKVFPTWYSVVEIPMCLGLALLTSRLRFDMVSRAG